MAFAVIVQQSQPSPEERVGQLLARFSYADSWRRQYDDIAVECYKLYVGYREPLPEELQGRSNLHIPKTYEHVDTIRARLVKTFFSTRPYIEFVPIPSGDFPSSEQDARKARVAAALVDLQLERNDIVRVWYDFVTNVLVMPAGILSVGWRYETRQVKRRATMPILNPETGQPVGVQIVEVERPVVVWDDNEVACVDFFDFWPDPRGRDIDSCRFVFHRQWATRSEIEDMLRLLADAGAGEVYPVDLDELAGAGLGLDEGKVRRLSAVGLVPETQDGYESEPEGSRGRQRRLYEVLHYWEDERHAIIVNRTALVFDGPNPYWRHMRKPFVVASYEPLPNEFYGLSAVQIIRHLQEELNTHRNQRIDNVSMVLNRMWRVSPTSTLDESELVSRPHGIVHAEKDEIEQIATADVTQSAYAEEAITKQDMEHALGTPSVVRGVDPARAETATEIVTKANNAALRFDVKIALMEQAVKRMAYLMDCNNQQFVSSARLVKLFNMEEAFQWARVEPWELWGEFDYRPAITLIDPAVNKELVRQRLTQVLLQVEATKNPAIDLYELTRAWAESMELPKRFRIVKPKEQVVQELMVARGAMPLSGSPPGVAGEPGMANALGGALQAMGRPSPATGQQGGPMQ